jgi:hypothetical protein
VCRRGHRLLGRARRGDLAVDVGRLYAVGHRVQVFERGTKTSEDSAKRVGGRAVRLRPAGGQLNTGDGIVSAADSDALAAWLAIVAV